MPSRSMVLMYTILYVLIPDFFEGWCYERISNCYWWIFGSQFLQGKHFSSFFVSSYLYCNVLLHIFVDIRFNKLKLSVNGIYLYIWELSEMKLTTNKGTFYSNSFLNIKTICLGNFSQIPCKAIRKLSLQEIYFWNCFIFKFV